MSETGFEIGQRARIAFGRCELHLKRYGLAVVSATSGRGGKRTAIHLIGVGRAGWVPGPSPLRTVRAGLPHTAL